MTKQELIQYLEEQKSEAEKAQKLMDSWGATIFYEGQMRAYKKVLAKLI